MLPELVKHILFEQYSSIPVEVPQILICETISNTVFVLDSRFTHNDHYFHAALQEAIDAFNNVLRDFGYHENLKKRCKKSSHAAETKTSTLQTLKKIRQLLTLSFELVFNTSTGFRHYNPLVFKLVFNTSLLHNPLLFTVSTGLFVT